MLSKMKRIFVITVVIVLGAYAIALNVIGVQSSVQGMFTESGEYIPGQTDFMKQWNSTTLIINGVSPYHFGDLEPVIPINIRLKLYLVNFLNVDSLYFPVAKIVFVPFVFFQYEPAAMIFLILNFLSSGLLLYLLFRKFGRIVAPLTIVFIILLFYAGSPFRSMITAGQFSVLSLNFFLFALLLDERNKPLPAGFFLTLSLIKYQIVGPLIFFFFMLEKKWKTLSVCFVMSLIVHLAFSQVMKVDPIGILLKISNIAYSTVINKTIIGFDAFAIFNRICVSTGSSYFIKIIPIVLILVALVFMIFLWMRIRVKAGFLGKMSVVSMFMLFLTYHGEPDRVVLLFPLVWVMSMREFMILRSIIFTGLLYFLIIFCRIDNVFYSNLPRAQAVMYLQVLNSVIFYLTAFCLFRITVLKLRS